MNTSMKVLIVEERDLLREKIAGILSRERDIAMVIQISSYSKLKRSLKETVPDLVLAHYFKFNRFCKDKKTSAVKLFPEDNILLYADEYERLNRIDERHISEQKVFDICHIQEEVKSFLQDARQRKHSIKS